MSQLRDQMPLPRGVDTNLLGTAIQLRAQEIAPDAFGGFYHDGDVYYVGFTQDLDANLAALCDGFPNVEINAYAARRTATELEAISSAIEATMLADPIGTILYAVPDQVAGIVNVGVSDPRESVAQAIASQYGDAVKVVQDEPLQPLAGGPASAIQACSPHLDLGVREGNIFGRPDTTSLAPPGSPRGGHVSCPADGFPSACWG